MIFFFVRTIIYLKIPSNIIIRKQPCKLVIPRFEDKNKPIGIQIKYVNLKI